MYREEFGWFGFKASVRADLGIGHSAVAHVCLLLLRGASSKVEDLCDNGEY